MNTNNTAGLNTPPVPLAASGAVLGATAYAPANGYWLPTPNGAGFATASGLPIIKGFIKIEVQTAYGNPCGTWQRRDPRSSGFWLCRSQYQPMVGLPPAQYGASEPLLGCRDVQWDPDRCERVSDVHPNAIIRLERVRDNPSNSNATQALVVELTMPRPPVSAIRRTRPITGRTHSLTRVRARFTRP